MKALLRTLTEYRAFWTSWVPLLVLAVVAVPVTLGLPLAEKQLIDGVLLPQRLDLLPWTVAFYGGVWLAGTLLQVANTLLSTYLGERLTVQLRQRLFAKCGVLSVGLSDNQHSGHTMSLFLNDVPRLVSLFTGTLVIAVGGIAGLAMTIVVMFNLNAQLAIVAGLSPVFVAALATIVTRPLKPAVRRVQEKAADLTATIQEHLSGIREVVAFGQENRQAVRFATALWELLRLRMRVTLLQSGIQGGQMLFGLTLTLVLFGYGGYLVVRGETTLGTLVAMRSLLSLLFTPAGRMFGLVSSIQGAQVSAERVYAFLDRAPRIQDAAGAQPLRSVAGEVTFDDVSFAYQAEQRVLKDITFTARPGTTVALVGPSGAGKTTLASLIARFHDPTHGRVLLDGMDLRDLPLAAVRSQIGFVFQDTFLFATSIRQNVAFGRPTANDEEIIEALRAANAWEFIERLPRGMDTEVGERGARLSEGQKQRLSIARALLRNPRILILDEPTSALDARSEHLLQSALQNLMRGRTSFVIAHRLVTILQADQILVIDNGRLVEQGAHAELMQREGLYQELFELQYGAGWRMGLQAAQPSPAGR